MTIFPDFSSRSSRSEIMDDLDMESAKMERTLEGIARVNRVLSGYQASLGGVERLAGNRNTLSLLDVGTGCGDFPEHLASWADKRQIDLDVLGIDLIPTAIHCAQRRCRQNPELRFERRDLFEMNGQGRFDIVHAALMLHHLDTTQAVSGLRRMFELSRLGLVINDLHRHPLAYLGSRLALPLISRNPIIHHDGALSVLRAFRSTELHQLAARAELPTPELTWRFPFRWQMVIPRQFDS